MWRKTLLLIVFTASSTILEAQSQLNVSLKSLVDAEFAFIDDSKKFGTKRAFYNSLSDSAITFGKTIRKGRKNFEGESDTVSWLNWKPVFTDIASSGDFGYNTGPWEFWNKRSDEKPVAFGEFVTVWKIESDGKWKAQIDIGISHSFSMRDEQIITTDNPLKNTKGDNKNIVIDSERKFIENKILPEYFSTEVRIYRENQLPMTLDEVIKIIDEQEDMQYVLIDGMTASSGDLGFVYGTATQKSQHFYYLRIWKKEMGRLKIVLDLLTPQ